MTSRRSGSSDNERSDLHQPSISPELCGGLLAACDSLLATKPWAFVRDNQALRMDIPELDLTAVVSIIGNVGQWRGVLIFPSAVGYARFCRAFAKTRDIPLSATSFDTEVLSLTFHTMAELPAPIRRQGVRAGVLPLETSVGDIDVGGRHAPFIAGDLEVVTVSADGLSAFLPQRAGWAIYPTVGRFDAGGKPAPLRERDIESLTACAGGLSAFLSEHHGFFRADDPVPVRGSCCDDTGREIHFAVPYNAFPIGASERSL